MKIIGENFIKVKILKEWNNGQDFNLTEEQKKLAEILIK